MAEEAAQVLSSQPSAGPFCVSSLPAPLAPQTAVSTYPSGPPAFLRSSAANACARVGDSSFLPGDNEERGVPMGLSPGPSPHSCSRGCLSLVCLAAAAAAAAMPVGSSRNGCGVPPVPPRAALNIIVLNNDEPVHPSGHHIRVAVLARTAASASTYAADASAGTAYPAASCCSRHWQHNRQTVNYEMDPRNTTHSSDLSAKVTTEDGKVTPAAAADVPASNSAPV
jgi:hypothetical protein